MAHIRQHDNADTLPGEECGQRAEAIDAAAVIDHGVAAVGLDCPSHSVARVGHFRVQTHLWYNHLRRVQLLHLVFRDNLNTIVFALVQMHQYPVAHLCNIGNNRSCWRDCGLCPIKGDLFDFILYLFVRMGIVAGFPGSLHNVEIAVLHP